MMINSISEGFSFRLGMVLGDLVTVAVIFALIVVTVVVIAWLERR
jgi:hypothetical protein